MSQEDIYAEVNQHKVTQFFEAKRDYEKSIYMLPNNFEHTISLDGLFRSVALTNEEERIALHNVANIVRAVLNQSESYSVDAFLADCDKFMTIPELKCEERYHNFFLHCPEFAQTLLGNAAYYEMLIRLLSHYAAQQNYFLLEYISFEMQNGVTYGLGVDFVGITAEQLNQYIYDLQPFKNTNEVSKPVFTEEQRHFFSFFLMFKALSIAEGVFRAEKALFEQYGFKFQ